MELNSVYDQFDPTRTIAYQQFTSPPATGSPYIAGTVISTFRCSSDDSPLMNREVINGIAIGNLAISALRSLQGSNAISNNPQGTSLTAAWDTYKLSSSDWSPAGPFTRYGRGTKAQCEMYRTVSQTQSSWERFGVTAPFIS